MGDGDMAVAAAVAAHAAEDAVVHVVLGEGPQPVELR